MDLFESPAFQRLERSIDAAVLRQKVIANNIANADTPYFKRSDVKFEPLLKKEMESVKAPEITVTLTHEKHIPIAVNRPQPGTRPEIVTDETSAMNNNQNNVDMDYEMALMAKNQLYYNMLIQQLNVEFKHLRTAIGGRG